MRDAPTRIRRAPARWPVAVVGAGPVGMAAALDLGLRGIPVVVLDDHEGTGPGSRAICFAQRTLEVADRLGCGEAMVEKGVVWSRGKVFHGDRKVFEFDLLAEEGHKFPAFINLQQPYFEKFLVDRARAARAAGAPIEIRGGNRVEAVETTDDGAVLRIATPDGPYMLAADWLIACDGAGSPLRGMLGLGFKGRAFEDNFLIADIRMKADLPTERRFWFEPPSGSASSTLLHRQPDDIWRVDFQIGRGVDGKRNCARKTSARARGDARRRRGLRHRVVVGLHVPVPPDALLPARRVLFAGDSAHQMSPFGARGANSGVQDADNLGWKLALVVRGLAPERLLDSYDAERTGAADENIRASTRSTDFISPKSPMSRTFRDAVLELAEHHAFARAADRFGTAFRARRL